MHSVNEILHLYTDEGNIDTTANHPFYVIGKGWVAAGDLVKGDEVYNLDGTTSTILGSEIEILDESVLVYNLEVEDFHSYFVGCVPVLVHNYVKKPQSPKNMQKQVERGQAPRYVDRVDSAHDPNIPKHKPHVHFKDGTTMNFDGTIHDKSKGVPNITNKVKTWLESNGWSGTIKPDE